MIKKLKIKNFKCLRDFQINLKNLTILVGENASGKSSIIQALLLFKQSKELENMVDPNKTIMLNGKYGMNLVTTNEIASVKRDEEKITFEIFFDDYLDSTEFTFEENKNYLKTSNKELITPDNKIETIIKMMDSFYYLNTERRGPRVFQDIPISDALCCGYHGEYTDYIIQKYSDLRLKAFKNSLFKVILEKSLDFIISGIQFDIRDLGEYNKAALKLKKIDSETDFISPTNIGFGIAYILPIIVTLLLATEKNKGIVILENPEVHLHPAGQSKMGEFIANIANIGVQIIVETHSEHIINGIRLAILRNSSLFSEKKLNSEDVIINYLKIENGESQITEILFNEYADYNNWPKGFFDQEELDLMKIIKLKKELKMMPNEKH